LLWTDGRYFIQAEDELKDSEYKLMKMGTPGYPSYTQWLKDNLKTQDTLGFDGRFFAQKSVEILEKELEGKDIQFIDEYDLVGEIWTDRPKAPESKAFIHELKYTGKTSIEKIQEV